MSADKRKNQGDQRTPVAPVHIRAGEPVALRDPPNQRGQNWLRNDHINEQGMFWRMPVYLLNIGISRTKIDVLINQILLLTNSQLQVITFLKNHIENIQRRLRRKQKTDSGVSVADLLDVNNPRVCVSTAKSLYKLMEINWGHKKHLRKTPAHFKFSAKTTSSPSKMKRSFLKIPNCRFRTIKVKHWRAKEVKWYEPQAVRLSVWVCHTLSLTEEAPNSPSPFQLSKHVQCH